jgi:histidyl-tRNA synthetase
VTVFDAERQAASLRLAAELRQAGLKAICYPETAKLPRQFKYADRAGIRVAAVIGPDEAARGQVTIKNLATGKQQIVKSSEAAQIVKQMVSSR